MGARNNKALREPKNKGAKAAALNKKFKKKPCSFCRDKVTYIDYKDIATLRKYISDRGKIRARRVTGAWDLLIIYFSLPNFFTSFASSLDVFAISFDVAKRLRIEAATFALTT